MFAAPKNVRAAAKENGGVEFLIDFGLLRRRRPVHFRSLADLHASALQVGRPRQAPPGAPLLDCAHFTLMASGFVQLLELVALSDEPYSVNSFNISMKGKLITLSFSTAAIKSK